MKYTITYTDDINERMLALFRAAVQDLAGDDTVERITDAARSSRRAHMEFICAIKDGMAQTITKELRTAGSAAFRAAHHGDMALRIIAAQKMMELDPNGDIAEYMAFMNDHIAFHFYEYDDVQNAKPDNSGDFTNPHTIHKQKG